jgi:hypothetical protein
VVWRLRLLLFAALSPSLFFVMVVLTLVVAPFVIIVWFMIMTTIKTKYNFILHLVYYLIQHDGSMAWHWGHHTWLWMPSFRHN